MAENIPPSASTSSHSTANGHGSAGADQPGRPYYDALRVALRQTLDKKRKLDEQMASIEDQIFKAETTYLEDTASSGNIVRGFDGWVKGVTVGGRGAADDRRRGRVRDEDRLFSRSSVGWMKASSEGDSNAPSHATTPTVSVPQLAAARGDTRASTPTSTTTKTTNKKKRTTEKDDDDDGKSVKRGKITFSRE